MKKTLSLLLILLMLCCLCPAALAEAPATRTFTDSVGRTVELPVDLGKVAVSGPSAQVVLFALCPDRLVGIATAWDKTAEQFVIDVGEPKKTIVEDLDALQAQTGIPFVHITATTAQMGDAYRQLGELLDMPQEAEALAAYCDRVYARTVEIAESVEKKNLLYITGDQGLNVIARGSYHAEVIDLLSNNLAVVESPSSKGTGNEVDMEQILLWNPDVILFAPGSIYADVADRPEWQAITAIQTGEFYEVPFGPYNWMGFPPSVQRYLGMMWMAQLLYPEAAQYDLYGAVLEYFQLFYHCGITFEQCDALMANSIWAQMGGVAPAA